jgi:hypothetical protein
MQGFSSEARRGNQESVFGKLMDRFGSSIKEFFSSNVTIDEYTTALYELIGCTTYVEEWLRNVLEM